MSDISVLVCTLGRYSLGIDAGELVSVERAECEMERFPEGLNIFSRAVRHGSGTMLMCDCGAHYDAGESGSHLAVVDFENIYSGLRQRSVQDSFNKMFSFCAENGFSIDKRRFAFLIGTPENILSVEYSSLRPLPGHLRNSRRYGEIWAALPDGDRLHLMVDLKKLLYNRIMEVFL